MATTETENEELVHRLHSEIWSKGNLDLVGEIVSEDYVEHNPTVPHDARGPSDYKQSVETFRTAFPDLTLTEADTIAEGDKVVSRVTMRGTHEGEFMQVEPTGTTVESDGIVINRIEDGQLVESWPLVDMMGVLQQLGVLEPPELGEKPMSTTEAKNKELERRFIEEAFNDGDLAVLDEILAEDYVGHTSTRAEDLRGRGDMKEYIEGTRAAFPDIELDLEHLVAEGEMVASHWTATGTHEGELMGIEPTGNSYEAAGMEITRSEDGRIVEHWHVGDELGMLQQLGVVPEDPIP